MGRLERYLEVTEAQMGQEEACDCTGDSGGSTGSHGGECNAALYAMRDEVTEK